MKKALFLDRDGVINKEKNYLYKIEEFEFIDGVFETCRYFLENNYIIVIITNQAGIARGKYTEKDFEILTNWMIKEFEKRDINISKVYYCPHHPEFSKECDCRKPNPGMILQAQKDLDIDLSHSILVGDKNSDIEAGINAGIKENYLIKTGHKIDENVFNVPVLGNLLKLKGRYMKKELIVLLGIPRSGTTMATAMFDVNPNIIAWFEPWHARQKQTPMPFKSVEDFKIQYKESFNIDILDEQTLMFKETTTNLPAIKWSENSIENLIKNDNINVKIIWLIRDISHAYLSRIHTAREHWGHPDMKIDIESFKNFVDFAYNGFKAIEKVVEKYNSCMLSYEELVTNTEPTLSKVMNFLNIDLHSTQLEYHKYFKNHKSAGDPEVSNSPKAVNPEKIYAKDKEWLELQEKFLSALNEKELEKYNYMISKVKKIREFGYIKI